MLKGIVKQISLGVIINVVVYFLSRYLFNNVLWSEIFAFITIMIIILRDVIKCIYKKNKNINVDWIFGSVGLILIIGVIFIITPTTTPTRTVPDFKGWPIVQAAYKADYSGFISIPITIKKDDEMVAFQDPKKGSLVEENSTVKFVAGEPFIKITYLNGSVNSHLYITGNSSGVVSNYPNLKIYIIYVYDLNGSKYQVQEIPPPQSDGTWQVRCDCDNLTGRPYLIYAIITTRDMDEKQIYDKFPNSDYILAYNSISLSSVQ